MRRLLVDSGEEGVTKESATHCVTTSVQPNAPPNVPLSLSCVSFSSCRRALEASSPTKGRAPNKGVVTSSVTKHLKEFAVLRGDRWVFKAHEALK